MVQDPESAMGEGVVVNSLHFFENKLKPAFQDKFNAYGDSAIVAIEKEIRGVILDAILEDEFTSIEEREFIQTHKKQLMEASDDDLMKTARKTQSHPPT
jgi:hypothetical protein